MKYIRTNNGVYELEHICKDGSIFHASVMYDCEGNVIYDIDDKTTFIAQADTIEELCDEFVCEWNIYPALCLLLKRVPKDRQKNIYGAIWTNRGLIYVAKMNDKGTLELL